MNVINIMNDIKDKIKANPLIAAIGLIVLIIIIIMLWRQNSFVNSYLVGLWNASEDFSKRSGIDGIMIYIGPTTGLFSSMRNAYIIMYVANSIIVSKKIHIDFSSIGLFDILSSNHYTKTITLYDINEDGKSVWIDDNEYTQIQDESIDRPESVRLSKVMPHSMRCEISIINGCMKWYGPEKDDAETPSGEETLYAELYKDNMATMQGETGTEHTEDKGIQEDP